MVWCGVVVVVWWCGIVWYLFGQYGMVCNCLVCNGTLLDAMCKNIPKLEQKLTKNGPTQFKTLQKYFQKFSKTVLKKFLSAPYKPELILSLKKFGWSRPGQDKLLCHFLILGWRIGASRDQGIQGLGDSSHTTHPTNPTNTTNPTNPTNPTNLGTQAMGLTSALCMIA